MRVHSVATAYRRLLSTTFLLTVVVGAGALTYYELGGGRWSYFECFYMTIVTLSTVGFGETLSGMEEVPGARILTLVLILVGAGILLAFLSQITALFVDGELRAMLRARRMQTKIDKLQRHIVVCGAGSTGEHVIRELLDADEPFVVIDSDQQRVLTLQEDLGTSFLYVIGDATDDHSLSDARVADAKGVIAALHTDKDNLFVTISAKHLNPNVRIVAKAIDNTTVPKLRRAGAHGTVSPNRIGGLRLVSEMIRPQAVQFLDQLMREDNKLRIEDVQVPAGSQLVGRRLAESNIRATGALVIAIRDEKGYRYNPGPDEVLQVGMSLIAIAHPEDASRLRDLLAASA